MSSKPCALGNNVYSYDQKNNKPIIINILNYNKNNKQIWFEKKYYYAWRSSIYVF